MKNQIEKIVKKNAEIRLRILPGQRIECSPADVSVNPTAPVIMERTEPRREALGLISFYQSKNFKIIYNL